MPFRIVFGDILEQSFDVIGNPTDERLSGEGGLDRQIYLAAGIGISPDRAVDYNPDDEGIELCLSRWA